MKLQSLKDTIQVYNKNADPCLDLLKMVGQNMLSYLVVEPTPLKKMLVKLDHFPKVWGWK